MLPPCHPMHLCYEQLGSQRVKKLIFENRGSGKKAQMALAG